MNSKQLAASWKRANVKKLQEELSERELRERCLRMAVNAACGRPDGAIDIVDAAEKFLTFITRARPAKRKK